MSKNRIGFTDRPVAEDQLGVDNYYKALADYIENCEAPTTISIQGDWGTGKTTAIRYIEKLLADRPRIESVCLNVWPYSSFEHGGNVAAALLQDFCSLLSEAGIKDDKLKKARQMTERFLRMAAYFGMSLATNSDASPLLGGGGGPGAMGSINEMKHFKDEIVKAIDSAEAFDRLVVFVDDLDRLNPRVALEILEGLKNFIDCEKCVFVLAIDFDIVSQGVRLKYGEGFEADKGRKFFDKIIQLQFHLPVNAYDIGGYLKAEFLGEGDDAAKYERMIRTLMGANPRNIKRAFNLLRLHELILAGSGKGVLAGDDKLNLFIILLIQLHNKDLYFDMIQHAANGDELRAFLRADTADEAYLELIDEALQLGLFDQDDEMSEVARNACMVNREAFCKNLVIASSITNSESADDAGAGGASEQKIGEYVRQVLNRFIMRDQLSKEMVHNMQQMNWCEENLHLSYPFLKRRKPNKTRHIQIVVGGRTAYWVKPVVIRDVEYYVCNQWYEHMRPYFDMWVQAVEGK